MPLKKSLCTIIVAGSFSLTILPIRAELDAHARAQDLMARAQLQRQNCLTTPTERIKLVKQAIALYPRDSAFYCTLAEEYCLLSDYKKTLKAAEQAIQLDGTNGVAWREKGLALVQLQDLRTGMEALERAVQVDPEDARSWLTLADHRRLTSPIAAEEAYKTCLQLIRSPKPKLTAFDDSKELIEVDCLCNLGTLRYVTKRYSEAKQFYEAARAADVNHEQTLIIKDKLEKVERQIAQQKQQPPN